MLPMKLNRQMKWTSPLDLLHSDLDRVFSRFLTEPDQPLTAVYPVDIWEDSDNLHVEAELPGFTRDQISVNYESGVLTIEAERKTEQNSTEKDNAHLNERRYNRVHRSFTLPYDVDIDKTHAKLSNGVLHLTLPKTESVKPKRIEIK